MKSWAMVGICVIGLTAGLTGQRAMGEPFEIRAYDSPMTIDTTFVLSDRALWGRKPWRTSPVYDELLGRVCERVVITELEMNAEQRGKGKVRITMRGSLLNSPGNDKRVSLRFEVMNGEEVVGTLKVDKIGIEEASEEEFKVATVLPEDAIKSEPPSRLRITMTVKND